MISCGEYFQGLLDYLSAPADPGTYHRLSASIAGNRQEDNPFVLYISVAGMDYTPPVVVRQLPVEPGILSGSGTEYFSDRVVPGDPAQHFDARQVETIIVSLSLPNGPLLFTGEQGDRIAQFSTLQCTDAGLVVCTSDFDRSMILVSFRKEVGIIVQAN
jgi:hypothetical protein